MKVQKILNIIAAIVLALVVITATSSAQTPVTTTPVTSPTIATPPPASLPIGSKAMLRAYAFEQVAGSFITIWGEAMMWNTASVTNVYFHPEVAPSLDEAMQAIVLTHFSFKVSEKTKPLSVYSELHNKDGMALFSGNADASVSDSGQIVCPSGVKMKMNAFVPIYVGENISGASVRMDDGNRESIASWNGYVFFNEDYTEKDGLLLLEYSDGNTSQQIGYSLRTSLQVPSFNVSGNVGAYVQDFQSFLDEGMLANSTMYVGINGFVGDEHEAPVASVTITSTRPVRFYCGIYQAGTNTLLENPLRGWIYKKDSDSESSISLLPGQWSGAMTLEPGQYFFYPETSLFETPALVNTGGGKG